MEHRKDLLELLKYIDPATCSYMEWTQVGMALKHEGYSAHDWESWSAKDARRYHAGECLKKWNTFNEGSFTIVTGGTIYQMAVESGYMPEGGHELEWDGEIADDGVVIDSNWIENKEVVAPETWNPVQQITDYLEILFEPAEYVGYCMQSYLDEKKGKYIPKNKGAYDRTAGELVEGLKSCNGDIGAVLGDYAADGGAWIRFNPLDGKGVNNANVTEFRFALVESDDMEIERQNAIIRELELPVAVLVHSGGKSLHAIVRIDAPDYAEYRKRVDYLYDVCRKNGMAIDTQNRNPSRLSRLPGVTRGDRKQFIVDKNIGKASWTEWKDWIEAVNDNLPDMEDLFSVWETMPDLAPELIEGILRHGHKMLMAGPSKAGKSFLEIELCIAIAEGMTWLGRKCTQGRVLYVNLELDRASCLHRFRDVYKALGIKDPQNLKNIDIWNLRGKAVPMDALVPKLIRRAQNKRLAAIIIDPIYKVITGDENSAEQMAKFCNQFDRICTELGCAVIYCHHHSKGAQGDKKSMDRASGSGVFARDPDAQLDMIELPVTKEMREQQLNRALCDECIKDGWLGRASEKWAAELSQDDLLVSRTVINYIENNIDDKWVLNSFRTAMKKIRTREAVKTAWQIDATLREFPAFEPVNVWFEYPIHRLDNVDVLKDVSPKTSASSFQKMQEARQQKAKEQRASAIDEITIAFEGLQKDGVAPAIEVAEEIGVNPDTLKRWFGKGKRSRHEYRDRFETFLNPDDGQLYLRKKEGTDGRGTDETSPRASV